MVGFTRTKSPVPSIECFDITAAYQLNIISIRSQARQHLNRLKDYLQPLVKVKPGQGQSIVQKIRNFRLLLMVLAEMELYSLQWSQAPQGTNTRPANRTVQASPSCPERRPTLYSLCHTLALVAGPAFFPATSHLGESKAAEMCTADGKNYVAHFTSEIFFSFFSSLAPFFHKLLQDPGKLIDSVCKWVLKLYKEDFFSPVTIMITM